MSFVGAGCQRLGVVSKGVWEVENSMVIEEG